MSKHKVLLQGIQFDEKSSYQKGPRLAPPLIREALYSGASNRFTEQLFSIENEHLIDMGDFQISNYFDIEAITAKHLEQNAKILTLGGDHSISYPILKALSKKYSKLDILHIDAHSDLYEHYEGDKHSHACPFARIMENGLAAKLIQVGIRTLNTHQAAQAEKYHVEIHQMKDLDLSSLSSFQNPVYISLDMDAFDPAFAPGVSHHEPGGLSSREVINLIHSIDAEIIGADIVEYNPKRDVDSMTAILAAKMMKEIIGKMLSN